MRFLIPLILIGLSITGALTYLAPLYNDVKELRAQVASFDEALANSKALDAEREKLTTKYNSISQDDLKKLSVLLPDSVDNIRLILEIEKIASPYGMTLKDVKYSTKEEATKTPGGAKVLSSASATKRAYGDWDLEFSTTGTYANFTHLIKDLEHNLRIVDLTSVEFSSDTGTGTGVGVALVQNSNDLYKYNLKIKTYWLKN